jgi:NitT/TauT family transport system substrate-binding protein
MEASKRSTESWRAKMKAQWAKAGALALGLALSTDFAMAKDKVTFGMSWLAQVEQGGFYQAIAEGIYDSYDLDVTLKTGGPQINTAQLLLAGALDFATVSESFIPINAIKEGANYTAIAAFFQKDPISLIAHRSMGYKSLADFKGKPILISTDAWDSYWKFLTAKYGFSDTQGRPYTYNMAPFFADKTLIQQGYATNEPFLLETGGSDPQVFLLADYGYNCYANVIMTSRKLIAEKPQLVQRFVDATIKGWYSFMHDNHDKALALIMKDNPDYTLPNAEFSTAAMKEHGLVESGDTATLGIGAMTDARWKDFFDAMVQANVYSSDLDYKQAYTLQFVNKGIGKP